MNFLSGSLARRGGDEEKQEEGGTGGSHTLQTSECLASFLVSKRYQISYQVLSLLSAKSTSRLNFSVSIVTTMKESLDRKRMKDPRQLISWA